MSKLSTKKAEEPKKGNMGPPSSPLKQYYGAQLGTQPVKTTIQQAWLLMRDVSINPNMFSEANAQKIEVIEVIDYYLSRSKINPDLAETLQNILSMLQAKPDITNPIPTQSQLRCLDKAITECSKEEQALPAKSGNKKIIRSIMWPLAGYRLALIKITASMRCLKRLQLERNVYSPRIALICLVVLNNAKDPSRKNTTIRIFIEMLYTIQREGNISNQIDNEKYDQPSSLRKTFLHIKNTEQKFTAKPPRKLFLSRQNTPPSLAEKMAQAKSPCAKVENENSPPLT